MKYDALIDIGSNTVKTLVIRRKMPEYAQQQAKFPESLDKGGILKHSPSFEYVEDFCDVTGLGKGLQNRLLQPESMAVTTRALARQVQAIRQKYPECDFHGVATSATREADNGVEFLGNALSTCGLQQDAIRIISPEEEAKMTFQSASLAMTEPFLNADPGGGSTELSFGRPGDPPQKWSSLRMGCGRWRDRYQLAEQISDKQIQDAYSQARMLTDDVARQWALQTPPAISVTGGTAYTLASLLAKREYPMFGKMPPIGRETLWNLLRHLATLTSEQREQLPGMPFHRSTVIVSGAIIIAALLDSFQSTSFLPNPYVLRIALLL